jgi:uncharacterized small protein (DUF1192 family)
MIEQLQTLLTSRCRKEVLQAGAMLGVCVLIAIIAVLLSTISRRHAENKNLEEQGAAASAAQTLSTGASLQAELPRLVAETGRLQKDGFGSTADRVAWVDAAVRTLDQLHPIAYTVEAGVIQTQAVADSVLQRYQGAGLEPPTFEGNDLALTIQGLQEDELVEAMERIRAQGGGVVRVEHCSLRRRADGAGLDAQCTLRRYSLHQTLAEAAS